MLRACQYWERGRGRRRVGRVPLVLRRRLAAVVRHLVRLAAGGLWAGAGRRLAAALMRFEGGHFAVLVSFGGWVWVVDGWG